MWNRPCIATTAFPASVPKISLPWWDSTVETGKWAGPVPNPFDCTIEAANEMVLEAPGRINRDPYGAWIARVRPVSRLEQALAGLVTGKEAEAGFCARAKADGIECRRV